MGETTVTDKQVIAAIRANHLKANIAQFERDPKFWGRPVWSRAWLDPGGTIFGPGPYLKVPIKGGEWDGTTQRVYPPARLQRRLAKLWQRSEATEGMKDAGRGEGHRESPPREPASQRLILAVDKVQLIPRQSVSLGVRRAPRLLRS